MTAVELFGRLPASASDAIFSDLLSSDKPGYKALTQSLATRRKLRPVFVDRKLRPDRHVWIAGELHRASNADLAEHVLQTWILTTHRELVCAFLDALEIPHDGKGMLDTLPAEPPVEAQRAAVETCLVSSGRGDRVLAPL